MASTFGSVKRLESGRYQARFTLPGTTRRIYAPHTFAKRAPAISWLAQQRAAIDAGTWTDPRDTPTDTTGYTIGSRPTFGDYCKKHLRDLKTSGDASQNSLISIESVMTVRLKPTFGETPVADITPAMVEDWYQTWHERLAVSTVNNTYVLLKQILQKAVAHGDIAENPCKLKLRKRRDTTTITSDKVASPEQVAALAALMPESMRLAVYLAAWCQARQGEILGLQRGDIHGLEGGEPTVEIVRQVVQKTGEIGPTKNRDTRSPSIPAELVPMIKAHLENHVGASLSAPLFPRVAYGDQPCHHNTMRNAWNRARKQVSGMESFKFHDLRHTGLTIFAQQGATLAELMYRGGHKDAQVALRYQHWSRERDRELTARMGGLVVQSLSETN